MRYPVLLSSGKDLSCEFPTLFGSLIEEKRFVFLYKRVVPFHQSDLFYLQVLETLQTWL